MWGRYRGDTVAIKEAEEPLRLAEGELAVEHLHRVRARVRVRR